MVDLVFQEVLGPHEVNGILDPHRAEAVLIVGPGVAAIDGRMSQQCLERRVAHLRRLRELGAVVLHQQGRTSGDRWGGHRRAPHGGVGGVAAVAARGHGGARGANVRLEAPVIGGPPTAEIGHRIVAGVEGADGDVVFGAGRRRRGVVRRSAPRGRVALVTVGPDDTEGLVKLRAAPVTADDLVNQLRSGAVVALPVAGEAVGGRVRPDRVVGDVGPVDVDGLVVVVLQVSGIGIEEALYHRGLEPVGQDGDTGGHSLVV